MYNHIHEIKIFQKDITLINNLNGSFLINKNKIVKRLKTKYPDKKNRKKLIRDFIKSITTKDNHMLSIKEQINLMKICFAADKSIKQNKKIIIKY